MRSTAEDHITQTEPDAVEQFTERLAGFHLDDWFTVASAAEADAPARSTALAVLEALIEYHALRMQAWSVLDDVETVAHCSVSRSSHRAAKRRTAMRLRIARNAANATALALLMRPLLCRDDFELLYRPFAALVPL